MIDRIVHLGFEVRIEMTLADDGPLIAQLTRAQVEELELAGGPDRLRAPRPGRARSTRTAAARGPRSSPSSRAGSGATDEPRGDRRDGDARDPDRVRRHGALGDAAQIDGGARARTSEERGRPSQHGPRLPGRGAPGTPAARGERRGLSPPPGATESAGPTFRSRAADARSRRPSAWRGSRSRRGCRVNAGYSGCAATRSRAWSAASSYRPSWWSRPTGAESSQPVGLYDLRRRGRPTARIVVLGSSAKVVRLHARMGEDERAGRRIHAIAVELEPGSAVVDEVELLILSLLVVLVDDPVSGLPTRPGVDPERRDVEVVALRTPGLAAVADLFDVLQAGDCVLAHRVSLGRLAQMVASCAPKLVRRAASAVAERLAWRRGCCSR